MVNFSIQTIHIGRSQLDPEIITRTSSHRTTQPHTSLLLIPNTYSTVNESREDDIIEFEQHEGAFSAEESDTHALFDVNLRHDFFELVEGDHVVVVCVSLHHCSVSDTGQLVLRYV